MALELVVEFGDDDKVVMPLNGTGTALCPVTLKGGIHLLFVVSRPADTDFFDPRTAPAAVLSALERRAPGRVTVEFLRPATAQALADRLNDDSAPAVDILHFDGPGAFRDNAGQQEADLCFEGANGKNADPISADRLNTLLSKKKVGLVVLSTHRPADDDTPLNSISAHLNNAGNPSVLLQDGFLAALSQSGDGEAPAPDIRAFFGRARELWSIETAFVDGARRFVIHGPTGQGKTRLAEEADSWLTRSGLFKRGGFITFAGYQGHDALAWALSKLGDDIGETLIDANAAEESLKRTPTLVVLDNLESLNADARNELLAAAARWSHAGRSRVLVTSHDGNLAHPDWPGTSDAAARYLELGGLREEDAVAWVNHLLSLGDAATFPPPAHDDLAPLLAAVNHHPLSLAALADQLRHRPPAQIAPRMHELLAAKGDGLAAALALAWEHLDPALSAHLPKLGVFQGGAFVPALLTVAEIPADLWPTLSDTLVNSGLARLGMNGNYIRFHPALTPSLWHDLDSDTRAALSERHAAAYYEFAGELYRGDGGEHGQMVRALARLELGNLLAAVHTALDGANTETINFVTYVNRFLDAFDLPRDVAALNSRVKALVIEHALNPSAAEVWKTLNILANIATSEGKIEEAREWRRKSRAAFAATSQAENFVQQNEGFIGPVVELAAAPSALRPTDALDGLRQGAVDGNALFAAVLRVMDGERERETLLDPLDWQHAAIVNAVLDRLAAT